MRPKVLVASALLWPNAARLCRAFRDVGFDVGAIAVAENSVHIAKTPSRVFLYSPAAPLDSLREAIKHHGPDLIIPCDERILGHLQTLKATDNRLAALVERSLGPGGASGEVARRGSLREIGRLPDVVVPRTDTVESLADLRKWARIHGLPAALKLDGSSGGVDVVIVRCESELRRAFLEMMVRRSPLKGLKRYVIDRDVEALRFGRSGTSASNPMSPDVRRMSRSPAGEVK